MNRSTADRCAVAILVVLPLLPVCGYALNASPQMVFTIGATAFVVAVLLLVWMFAARVTQLAGLRPEAGRLQFSIRDLLCLMTVLIGMMMFIVSGFRCEAAEKSSRPDPLPTAVFRQFVWELELGLVCITVGGLIGTRSVLNPGSSTKPKSG